MSDKHFTFADLGKEILNGWGFDGESAGKVYKSRSADERNTFLLAYLAHEHTELLRHLKPIVAVVGRAFTDYMGAKTVDWRCDAGRNFYSFLKKRESEHGPCPILARKAMYSTWMADAARDIDDYFRKGWLYLGLTPPLKGSDARKEYDRWMRKKLPKKTSVDTLEGEA